MYDDRVTATVVEPTPQAERTGVEPADVLLLIHGFPLTSEMWRPQRDALASPALRVVTPDLAGFGSAPGAITSLDDAADALAASLDGMGAPRVIVGGFSMGGYIALAFARRHAARLHGLLLVDTKAEPDTEDGKKGRYALAERARAEGKGVVIDAMLPRLVSDSSLNGRPDVVQQVLDIESGATLDGIVAALHAMAERPSSVDDLPRITVPTLVIVGKEDVITPVADAEAMASAIPAARLVIIPDAGHLTALEQPEAVNAAIRDWLATVL
jgi:pimeloyl-ACP methyl ester carboxylesterase